jgi:hypothetical protein
MMGGGWPCPFFSYTLAFTLQLRKSTHNLSQGSQLVLHTGHCADFAAFFRGDLDWPAEYHSSSIAHGWLQSALGWHKCLHNCRTKRYLASVTSSQSLSQCFGVVGGKWNPHILGICLLLTYQGALVTVWRHLDCSICTFWMWVRTADVRSS